MPEDNVVISAVFVKDPSIADNDHEDVTPPELVTPLHSPNADKVNGNGSGAMKPMAKCVNGTEYTLTGNVYKAAGYSFLGWSTDPDAAVPEYLNKEKVGNLASTNGETVTLYAIWEPVAYTISYKNVTGARIPEKTTYTIEEEFELPVPVKEGYIFLGWYTTANFKTGTRVYHVGPGATGAMTLYAKWMLCS